jgi:2-polyprenyl-3-methyl-5-hydroxy-6-metoxy-1,4-benzoquinol methylase
MAQQDPLWAICTDPRRRNGAWDPVEFFATGEREVGTVIEYVRGMGLMPGMKGPALDFGCGVGRLTGAPARHFGQCYGVDISATMVWLASEHHRADSRCRFFFNEAEDLSLFSTGTFSFAYSSMFERLPARGL